MLAKFMCYVGEFTAVVGALNSFASGPGQFDSSLPRPPAIR